MDFNFLDSTLPTGLSVIEASAGTGKTYAISHLVPRLLLEGQLEHLSELLLVTYTKDAAGELADRVRRVLSRLAADALPDEATAEQGVAALRARFLANPKPGVEERLRRALLEMDQLCVSTIHSFCQRTLQCEGTLCGLPALPELIPDTQDLLEETVFDLWCRHISQDATLATIATEQGWTIRDDQKFVSTFSSLENVYFLPPAGHVFQEARRTLETEHRTLKGADVEAFLSRLLGVGADSWKKDQHEACKRHVEQLRRGVEGPLEAATLQAILFFSGVHECLMGRSKVDKALKAEVEALPVRQRFETMTELLRTLRWSWQQFCAGEAVKQVAFLLKQNRQITYDGLINTLREALQAETTGELLANRLRERHRIGIIDESQDTDPRQFGIFQDIFIRGTKNHRLILIGDPKQAIYGFRGADLATYIEARESALSDTQSGQRLFNLTKTFRAPQALVSATNALFQRPQAFLNPSLDFTPASSGLGQEGTQLLIDGVPSPSRLEAWLVPDEDQDLYGTTGKRINQITQRCASMILQLLQTGSLLDTGKPQSQNAGAVNPVRVLPSDIAILTNSNREADAMALALRELGIPVVVSSAGDVMSSDEATEIELLLRALENPRKAGLRHAALATRMLGFTITRIQEIRSDPDKDEAWLDLFQKWRSTWETKGIAALFAEIEAQCPLTLNLARGETGERRSANFRQLTGLLQEQALRQAPTPEHQLRWLRQEITRAEGRSNIEERQLLLESDEKAVQIVTMHKSKGLEYKLVFCPFLWAANNLALSGTQVLRRGGAVQRDTLFNLDLGKEAHREQFEAFLKAQLEDRIRLCYVALTRAKVKAWFVCGALGNKNALGNPPASPLDWLLRPVAEQPDLHQAGAFDQWARDTAQAYVPGKADGRGSRHQQGLTNILTQTETKELIAIVPLPSAAPKGARLTPPPRAAGELQALPAASVPKGWRVTSFSGLTKEKHAKEGRSPATPTPKASEVPPQPLEPSDNRFLEAPAGADIGTLVHDFIEKWDFTPLASERIHTYLEDLRFRSPKASREAMEAMLFSLFENLHESRLPGLECALHEACAAAHGSEWHFHLPISPEGLNGARLAEVFKRHAAPEHRYYAQALQDLSANDVHGLLHGYLQGFIDRVVLKDDCWGVIDWKTNRLGENLDDYHPDALLECAMEAHYFLQTHLYLVALRRYLRLKGQACTLSGAWLVFLRAVKAGSTQGLLHINPPEALLDGLEELFVGEVARSE